MCLIRLVIRYKCENTNETTERQHEVRMHLQQKFVYVYAFISFCFVIKLHAAKNKENLFILKKASKRQQQ